MSRLYLAVDIGAMAIPFIFSFHPRIRFHRVFVPAFASILLVAAAFILWDIYFTRLGVWGFNSEYLTGFYIANLPIEEVLFFIMIPFSCLFTYYTLNKTIFKNVKAGRDRVFTIVIGVAMLIFGLLNFARLYTSWTLCLCALGLFIAAVRRQNLASFARSYTILLIPFFIVNGILTGTGLPRPVVWYNNAENLGIRILTIPVEDFFYGMLLILLNVLLFDVLCRRWRAIPGK